MPGTDNARDSRNTDKYKDIIDLPRPVSRKHIPMSIEARAAQFAPFAALTGFDEVIEDTADINIQRTAAEIEHELYED